MNKPSENKPREQEAQDAYFKLLKNKGADLDNIKRRQQCVQKLVPAIETLEADGLLYRDAVDSTLAHVAIADWPLFLTVVREYFHFWIQDIKTIAAMYIDAEFDAEISELKPLGGDLKGLWKSIEQEKFTTVENWPVKSYILALKQHGASTPVIDTRIRLVRLLIVQMRAAPELNNKYYRLAVDSMMHLFTVKQMRNFFLTVVREFFNFWIGDPEASNHIHIVDISNAA